MQIITNDITDFVEKEYSMSETLKPTFHLWFLTHIHNWIICTEKMVLNHGIYKFQ